MRKKATTNIILVLMSAVCLLLLLPVFVSVFASGIEGNYVAGFFAQNNGGLMQETVRNEHPFRYNLSQYFQLLIADFWFYPTFWNSCLYAFCAAAGAIVFALPAGFALAAGKIKARGIFLSICAVLMLLPLQVTILPQYIGLRDLGLLNTRTAILLPALFSPFALFLTAQYLQTMDKEQLEAARLETSSVFSMLLRIVLPQSKICIGAVVVYTFAESWNMVEQPEILLKNKLLYPVSVMIGNLENADLSTVFAATAVFMIPPLLLYFFFEEKLQEGLEAISMKL